MRLILFVELRERERERERIGECRRNVVLYMSCVLLAWVDVFIIIVLIVVFIVWLLSWALILPKTLLCHSISFKKKVQVEKFERPCQLPGFLMPSFEQHYCGHRHKIDNSIGMPFYLFLKLFTANAWIHLNCTSEEKSFSFSQENLNAKFFSIVPI